MDKLRWLSWSFLALLTVFGLVKLANGPETIEELDIARAKKDSRRVKRNSALQQVAKRWTALGRRGEYVKLTKVYNGAKRT